MVGHLRTAQHPLLLGDEVGEIVLAQVAGIIGANLVPRRAVVGIDIDFSVLDADGAVGVAHVAGQTHIVWVAVFQVFDPQLVAISVADPSEDIPLIIGHGHLVEQQRLALVLQLDVVLALRCAQFVVLDLVELVLGRLGILGCVIAAVEEAVAQPLCVGELGPDDVVIQLLSSVEVNDKDFVPVAAIAADDIGHVSSIV